MKNISIIIFCFVIIIFSAACSNKGSSDISETQMNGQTAYPVLDVNPTQKENDNNISPYPSNTIDNGESAYPIQTPINHINWGPQFTIDEPVLVGSMKVTGTGPVEVPIRLIDVSEMGLVLAETTINSDGIFTFTLQSPLIKSHSIGLQIGDLSKTKFNYDDFIFGKEYRDLPLIGIIFAMASVVEK